MSLLKPKSRCISWNAGYDFTFHYVSIKTYAPDHIKSIEMGFTFHYVSIKTYIGRVYIVTTFVLYIPLCLY